MGRTNSEKFSFKKIKEMFSALPVLLIENDENLPATDVEDIENWEVLRENPEYRSDVELLEKNEASLRNLKNAKMKNTKGAFNTPVKQEETISRGTRYQVNKIEPIR